MSLFGWRRRRQEDKPLSEPKPATTNKLPTIEPAHTETRQVESRLPQPISEQDRADIKTILTNMGDRGIVPKAVSLHPNILIDIFKTLSNPACPLNEIIRNSQGRIICFVGCHWPPQNGELYVAYFGTTSTNGLSRSDIKHLLDGAQKLHLKKLSFHGWNPKLNEFFVRAYRFAPVPDRGLPYVDAETGRERLVPYYELALHQPRAEVVTAPAIPKEARPDREDIVNRYLAVLVPELQRREVAPNTHQQLILRSKLLNHLQLKPTLPTDLATLADAIAEKFASFFATNMRIARVLELHAESMKAMARKRGRQEVAANPTAPPEVLLSAGEYQLVRLATPSQLQAESQALGHCVGTSDHYSNLIKNADAEILSFRKKGHPLATIEYNLHTRAIAQMKIKDNDTITGGEDFTPALLRMLQQLPNTKDHTGQSRRVSSIGDTENIKLSPGMLYTMKGQRIPYEKYKATDGPVLKGKIIADASFTSEQVRALSTIANLTLEATRLPDNVKRQLTEFAGNIIDHSQTIEYPRLRHCGHLNLPETTALAVPQLQTVGNIEANHLESVELPELLLAGRLYLLATKSLVAPKLETITDLRCMGCSSLLLPGLRVIEGTLYCSFTNNISLPTLERAQSIIAANTQQFAAPQLKTVQQLRLPEARAVSLPALRQITHSLDVTDLKRVLDLPALEEAGEITACSTIGISAPRLVRLKELLAQEATTVSLPMLSEAKNLYLDYVRSISLPNLVSIRKLNVWTAKVVDLPKLETAESISDLFAEVVNLQSFRGPLPIRPIGPPIKIP